MNAERQFTMPQREDYYGMVKAFMPGCEGEELDCRASLLLMRDRAMSTKRVASEYGWTVLNLVQSLACDHALRSMTLEDLQEIRRVCIRLVSCASGLDAVFAPRLPLEDGANARG